MKNPLGSLASAVVLLVLLAVGIYKIPPIDIPWHLATGRLVLEQGYFPVTNTFSWTWPDHPLHQQYPLFQVALALLVDTLGWPSVTIANAGMWAAAALLWLLWGTGGPGRMPGRGRELAEQPLLWLLVVMGLQRHHVPRPEVFTLLGLGLMLLAIDALRSPRTRAGGVLGVALAQWLMVNGHQMWPLGLALQLSFLLHMVLVRLLQGQSLGGWAVEDTDWDLPWGPPLAALGLSLLGAMVSPLGPGIYAAPLTTLDTLLSQGLATATGAQAAELRPVWTDPLSAVLLVLLAGVGIGWTLRARRRIVPFELAVMFMGLLLVGAAVRGMPFAALALGAVAARSRSRALPILPSDSPVRPAAAAASLVLSLSLFRIMLASEPAYFQRQSGLGRSVGDWGDGVVAFLRASPPPGELMNLGWVAGNPLIGGVYPVKRVFVDPRWEAYPRPFLLEAIASMRDASTLQALLERYEPGAIVAEMWRPEVQQRVGELWATGEWPLVYVDTEHAVLVRRTPASERWLAEHPALDPRTLRASLEGAWLHDYPVLLAQQQVRVARLLIALGQPEEAEALLSLARQQAAQPPVASDLRTVTEMSAAPAPRP